MSRDAFKDLQVNDRKQHRRGRILNGQPEYPSIQHVPIFLSSVECRGRMNGGTEFIVEAIGRWSWELSSGLILAVRVSDADWKCILCFLYQINPTSRSSTNIGISSSMAGRKRNDSKGMNSFLRIGLARVSQHSQRSESQNRKGPTKPVGHSGYLAGRSSWYVLSEEESGTPSRRMAWTIKSGIR